MVGRAVATMVWSNEARVIPSMSAPSITRIRRCSAFDCSALVASGPSPSEPAAESVRSRGIVLVPFSGESGGKELEQACEFLEVAPGPLREQLVEPVLAGTEQAFYGASAGVCEPQPQCRGHPRDRVND